MIRKSVETRDWLHTLEPRSVRSVMKRVVEEVTILDKQVGTLYEEGAKKEQGSGEGGHTVVFAVDVVDVVVDVDLMLLIVLIISSSCNN